MKKLLFILPIIFFAFTVNAQQTEDDIYVGKSKTYGNYKGIDIKGTGIIKPLDDKTIKVPSPIQTIFKGPIIGICTKDCCKNKLTSCSITVQRGERIVTIGTLDNGFTVPKAIAGRTVIVEGKAAGQDRGERKGSDMKIEFQKDIQFAATGIKVID